MSGRTLYRLLLVALWGAVGQGPAASATPGVTKDAFWSAHVEPVLREHCLKCHGEEKRKSGLDLRSPEAAFRGGDRGPAVVPGRPAESLLFTLVHPEGDPEMPPPASRPRALNSEERESLRTWIERLEPRPAAAEVRAADNMAAPVRQVTWTPPADLRPAQVVDGFLERSWKAGRIQPSRPVPDSAWVRRVYLDLAGRLPTGAEADAFLSDRSRDRRSRLVDRLLESSDHAAWMAEVFDTVLLGKAEPKAGKRRIESGWTAFLADAFRLNRPWDSVVRDLIVARPERPEDRGAMWFLYERNNNPQAIAEALAPVVFGVQIQCAQCHDHMVAREIKQAHYWGLVAAFNRSKNVETPSGPAVAESAVGGFVTFANLKKESQPAKLVFFNGRQVDEAWPAAGEKPADDPALYLVPPPKEKEPVMAAAVPRFSRRTALAEAVTRDNPLLARAMVNRLWALVFGRGLVHPVELMDSKHPPSHPELLDWLAADFARSGHDVRRLLRELVHSRAYQLDSRPAGERRPPAETFACALAKPLTAGQLERSWTMVLQIGATNGPSPEFTLNLRRLFPQPFESEYHASLHQALFLANNPEMQGLLKAGPGSLVGELARRSTSEAVERAFRAVYGRRPDASERRAAREFLATHPGETGVRDLAWSLATSAEFLLGP